MSKFKRAISARYSNGPARSISSEEALRQMSWALSYPSASVQDHFKRMLTLSKLADSGYKARG